MPDVREGDPGAASADAGDVPGVQDGRRLGAERWELATGDKRDTSCRAAAKRHRAAGGRRGGRNRWEGHDMSGCSYIRRLTEPREPWFYCGLTWPAVLVGVAVAAGIVCAGLAWAF